ncbi:MAG: D-glycerate dehydrogenase [Clostridia bacterium]|nr:D-glycerate dehydrogenase [Clostridia bacterium]
MRDKMKVLITHPIPPEGLAALRERYDVLYPAGRGPYTAEEMLSLLPECDAVLACGAVTRGQIEAAPRLRVISNYGAGYDQVDVDAADERGVIVTNIPDSTTESTAELAFALLVSVYRRVAELDAMLRAGPPENAFGMGRHMGHNLNGATLGIVGMGRIGRRLAGMARAFGMDVVYHNRRRLAPDLEAGARWLSLDELLKQSDAVSINCPLTPETRGLIGAREIGLMKEDAVLINTSRGGTVDYDALCDALEAGRLRGAGLDVFPDEPRVPKRLLALSCVTLTPHVGTNTHEARKGMAEACAARIIDALEGRTPPNMVNRHLAMKKPQ